MHSAARGLTRPLLVFTTPAYYINEREVNPTAVNMLLLYCAGAVTMCLLCLPGRLISAPQMSCKAVKPGSVLRRHCDADNEATDRSLGDCNGPEHSRGLIMLYASGITA
ncbi:hypothetical protein NDU88_005035 [Pleurodeles waltl]|uniref:Uncharacterized protein n=1 Tax=Pleurodeles waltl TaxID=8319 RepID=A0AAV7VLH8_PLEWA|nr:hypothetical protein NDU88_005035 [Pleurodeles waltl]